MTIKTVVLTEGNVPVKIWTDEVEDRVKQQLTNIASLLFIHKHVAHEHYFDANVWVTRKGAIRAREGDLGIIPGKYYGYEILHRAWQSQSRKFSFLLSRYR